MKKSIDKIKKFFKYKHGDKYKFDWNDLRAFISLMNVILIMRYGLSIAWFGLLIAIFGIIKDLTTDRRVNGLMIHTSNVILNIYFLLQI